MGSVLGRRAGSRNGRGLVARPMWPMGPCSAEVRVFLAYNAHLGGLSQRCRGDLRRLSPANARLTGSDRCTRETGGKRSGAALEIVGRQWRLQGALAYT